MAQTIIFLKKEFVEMLRSYKILILLILFSMFGVMNPAIAKLTPWLFDTMKDSLKEQGIQITPTKVTAFTSWEQFYKNMPMALIVIVAIFSGILIQEYQKGTLINMLTKGLGRSHVITAKFLATGIVWSVCYWLSFSITYCYNTYFWNEDVIHHEILGAAGIYLVGIWLLSLIIVWSVIGNSMATVLLGTGAIFGVSYFLSIISQISKFLPTTLLSGQALISDKIKTGEFLPAIGVILFCIVLNYILSVVLFQKKQL